MNLSKKKNPRFWTRWKSTGAIMGAAFVVVDERYPVDYSKIETPSSYRCTCCGVGGVKLWREYQTFLEHQKLYCATCAGEAQKEDVSDIDAAGLRSCEIGAGRTDQIGWLIPAVPTENNDTFWGYTSVPQAGVEWWKRLPTLSAKK